MKNKGMNSETTWTKDAFSQRLRDLASSGAAKAPPSRDDDPRIRAYREATAVISDFDPETLKSPSLKGASPGDFTIILPDSEHVIGGEGRRTLRADVRARTLRRMLKENSLKKAVMTANPGDEDYLHALLLSVVKGKRITIPGQTEAELSVALELSRLLGSETLGLPPLEDIRKELGRARLLAPMRHVADEHFRGREQELEELRNYVGVADPKTVTGSLFRAVRNVLDLKKRPPLMIFGPGGMGKSAMMSRFVLEHANLKEKERFPFAFLDFDRPNITAREPLTLLAEVLFQLGVQYPSIWEDCKSVKREVSNRVAWVFNEEDFTSSSQLETTQISREITSSTQEQQVFINATVELFAKVTTDNQPLLLVLDTFEEVQYHGSPYISGLFRFLQQFQNALPRLRVVLAGRTRETREKVKPLALEPLRKTDARALLASFDFPSQMAEMIVAHLGGNPLTLRLAMKVFMRDGLDANKLDEIEGGSSFLSKVDDELVQGQLYRRFLNHIPDEEVRAVAHPGLVLRRLTPTLILEVLAGPCDLLIHTREEAQSLFLRLARQDTLVNWDGDAIVHRSDVRRIMVKLLRKAESEKVNAIHEGAVRYYEPFNDPVSRAEEVYHRYCLSQETSLIEERWLPGIEDRLRPAIGEIPESKRHHLEARTGGEFLSTEDWSGADQDSWEIYAANRVQQLNEHARYEDALELLRERKDRTDSSALFNLEVVALARLGDLEEAQQIGEKALLTVRQSGEQQQELELLGSLGSVARRRGNFAEARKYLFDAADLAEERGEIMRSLDSLFLALESGRWAGGGGSLEIRNKLASLVQKVDPKGMMASPVLFDGIAREIKEINPEYSAFIRDVLGDVETVPFRTPEGEKPGSQSRGSPVEGVSKAHAGQIYRLMNRLFRNEDELEKFLYEHLDTSLRSFSRGGSLQSSNYELITTMGRHGKMADLIEALHKFEPENFELTEIVQKLEFKLGHNGS